MATIITNGYRIIKQEMEVEADALHLEARWAKGTYYR